MAELSLVELALGHHDAALASAAEALQAARQAETPTILTAARLAHGQVALARGDRQAAADAATWVLEQGVNLSRQDRAQALLLRGLAHNAEADLHAAWDAAEEANERPTAWRAALALAGVHRQAGAGEQAARWQHAAEAEIEAVAASFDDSELAESLRRQASEWRLP